MAKSSEKYIAILDVGHGNCTILKDGDEVCIVDCGGRGSGLLEFISQQKIASIKILFISHADKDHIGGLIALLSAKQCRIEKIVANADGTKQSELWGDFLYELNQQNEAGNIDFRIGISRTKDRIPVGQLEISITGPTPFLAGKGVGGKDGKGRTVNSNSISASFHVFWKDEPVVYLAGDIDQIALDDMLSVSANLKAPVLVFPHHGGAIGNYNVVEFTEILCEAVRPDTVLFSIGRTKYNNPRPDVVSAVRKANSAIRISCTQMSLNCAKKIKSFTDEHLSPYFAKGREPRECCGGTFVIKLDQPIFLIPDPSHHQKFIRSVTSKPMCIH